ncbi:MAG: LPS export ABC transporter periplasmic protein LptC [Bacteroidia bacterium]|nr:LPS export ABC transporter periplasmic protein LptC [Bacteroidia bacterium]
MKSIYLLLILTLFISCDDENSQDANSLLKKYDGVKSESFGVTYYFSDSARVTAELKAKHIIEKEYKEPKVEVIHIIDQGLRLNFLNSRGKAHSFIEADSGRFYIKDRKGSLFGNVKMLNSKGESLETEVLHWNEKKDSIFTDQKVRIETSDKIIIGKRGFRSNKEFTNYIIYGIEGEIETEDDI